MSAEDVPLAVLAGPFAPAAGVAGLRSVLEPFGPVLSPALVLTAARPADLSPAALAVLAAVSATGADEAVLIGVGLGAMVAMQVAATHPRRVRALLLCTAVQVEVPGTVHQAVTGVLPARALQVLPGGRRQALRALDQVRAPDYAPLAPLVAAPTRILHGEHDGPNGRASRRLARALPDAVAVPVPGGGPGWMWTQPEAFADAVAAYLPG